MSNYITEISLLIIGILFIVMDFSKYRQKLTTNKYVSIISNIGIILITAYLIYANESPNWNPAIFMFVILSIYACIKLVVLLVNLNKTAHHAKYK